MITRKAWNWAWRHLSNDLEIGSRVRNNGENDILSPSPYLVLGAPCNFSREQPPVQEFMIQLVQHYCNLLQMICFNAYSAVVQTHQHCTVIDRCVFCSGIRQRHAWTWRTCGWAGPPISVRWKQSCSTFAVRGLAARCAHSFPCQPGGTRRRNIPLEIRFMSPPGWYVRSRES